MLALFVNRWPAGSMSTLEHAQACSRKTLGARYELLETRGPAVRDLASFANWPAPRASGSQHGVQ
eukprot:scaffold93312_cov105-Phaeocystis_antarctica.AAC.3